MSSPDLAGITEQVVAWRRQLHSHPELGFAEHRTSALVERELQRAGIATTRMVGTGVVGVLEGGRPGKTLALRADMDALPIEERSGEPFSSTVPNVMHACGHDAHTAMLLGAAVFLAAERASLSGTIKFIFQPAEEGPGGAKPMVDAGVLESPHVDAAIMLHVSPLFPTGIVGWRAGAMTASCDDFEIQIAGRGGHGGYPHRGVDTIPIAAEIVTALQRIASREIDPLESVVVSIGTIAGGYRRNVIADKTQIGGTIRCLNEAVRVSIPERMERIIKGICSAHGARHTMIIEKGYPAVINEAVLTRKVAAIAETTAEVAGLSEMAAPLMGAEDFAYFAQAVPGCYVRLGIAPPGELECAMLHSPQFRLDENALRSGVALFRALAHKLPATL